MRQETIHFDIQLNTGSHLQTYPVGIRTKRVNLLHELCRKSTY